MTFEDWGPLFLFGVAMVAAMAALSWFSARSYRTYLERHTEETRKINAHQREVIEGQLLLVAAADRQVAALERVAAALERRA